MSLLQDQTMLCDEFPPDDTSTHELDSNESGLLFEHQYEKFGIINQNNETELLAQTTGSMTLNNSHLQRSSVCSSSASGSSVVEGRIQQMSPAFNSNLIPVNSSDSDKLDSIKSVTDSSYMMLNNEGDNQV